MVLQSSIMSVFRQGGGSSDRAKWRWYVRDVLKFGSSLQFVPQKQFQLGDGLDRLRDQPRIGVRPPRIALILGDMKKDLSFLMLSTVMKNLKGLGYHLEKLKFVITYGRVCYGQWVSAMKTSVTDIEQAAMQMRTCTGAQDYGDCGNAEQAAMQMKTCTGAQDCGDCGIDGELHSGCLLDTDGMHDHTGDACSRCAGVQEACNARKIENLLENSLSIDKIFR